jgi:hypothetical protein
MDPVTLEAHAGNGEQANENSRGAELRNIELDGGSAEHSKGQKAVGEQGRVAVGQQEADIASRCAEHTRGTYWKKRRGLSFCCRNWSIECQRKVQVNAFMIISNTSKVDALRQCAQESCMGLNPETNYVS